MAKLTGTLKSNETKHIVHWLLAESHFSRFSFIILDKDRNRQGPEKHCQVTDNVQKIDEHSRNSHKFKFSMKSLPFSCLLCALNLYFDQTFLRWFDH